MTFFCERGFSSSTSRKGAQQLLEMHRLRHNQVTHGSITQAEQKLDRLCLNLSSTRKPIAGADYSNTRNSCTARRTLPRQACPDFVVKVCKARHGGETQDMKTNLVFAHEHTAQFFERMSGLKRLLDTSEIQIVPPHWGARWAPVLDHEVNRLPRLVVFRSTRLITAMTSVRLL